MRYLKPTGTLIKINEKSYNLKFTLEVIDDLQDKTKLPVSEILSLTTNKRTQKVAVECLLKYLTGDQIEIKDNYDYYSSVLMQTYIDQLKSKPFDGEKKGEVKEEFEFINVERHFYIATVVLRKSEERAWSMTLGEINTLYKEHGFEKGWLKEDKEVNIDDVI